LEIRVRVYTITQYYKNKARVKEKYTHRVDTQEESKEELLLKEISDR
jgi:hypothetical protein